MSARARFFAIVGLLVLITFLSYFDRQIIAVLKPVIKERFGFGDGGYALIVNAFTFTYAIAYLGSGWLVERIGLRWGISLCVAGWSVATLACAAVSSPLIFGSLRAALGLLEPVVSPGLVLAMTLWCTQKRRATWMSVCGAGGSVGTIIAAPLVVYLARGHSWSKPFLVPGMLGLCLAFLWWQLYRDPASPKARDPQPALPWARLWAQPAFWRIVATRFITDPVWYFCLFWMPGYLQEQRGLTLQQSAAVGWIPFLVAAVGGLGAAAWSDRLAAASGQPVRSRTKLLVSLSALGPLVCLAPWVPNLGGVIALLCIAGIVCLAWLYILQALVSDTFPAGNVASVWAIAGAFGAAGAILSNFLIGHFGSRDSGAFVLVLLGLLQPGAAALLWLLTRRSTGLNGDLASSCA